eukprot:symbB.v1.2.002900.t1/scaffold156.1/size293155/12
MAKGKGKGDKGGKGETPTPMTPGPVNPIPFVMPAKATGPPPPPPHAADEFVEVPVESPSEMPPVVGPSAAPATTAKAAPAVAVAKENEPKRGGKGAMPPPEPVGAPKAGKGGPSQAKPPAAAPRGSVGGRSAIYCKFLGMVKRHFPQQQQLRLQAADLELPPDVQRLQPSLPSPKRFSPFRGPTMFATVCVKRLLHHGLSLQHVGSMDYTQWCFWQMLCAAGNGLH